MRGIISASVIPIILGNEKKAYKISASLFFRYGLISNIFAKDRSFASYFAFFSSHHVLPPCDKDCFILMSLDRFYNERGESTYLLIPAADEYSDFINRNRDILETRFIVRTPDDIIGNKDVFLLADEKKGQ